MDSYICWALWKGVDQWASHFPAEPAEVQFWGHVEGFSSDPVLFDCYTVDFSSQKFLINLH